MVYNPLEPRDPLGRWVKENGGLSPERVISEKSTQELADIAMNPKTPQAVLNELARTDYQSNHPCKYTPDSKGVYFLTEEECADFPDYNQQEKDYDIKVRCAAIENGADKDVLKECSFDESHYVRAAVASSTTDRRTLDALSSDDAYNVRKAVAGNPHTPKETVERLLKDKDLNVMAAALKRDDLSPERLGQAVSDALARSPRLWRKKQRTLEAVAENRNADADTLHKCLNFGNEYVREIVAVHEHTSPDDLRECIELDTYPVREAALTNPHMPSDILDELADSPDLDVRTTVAIHPNTSTETLDRMYSTNGANPSVRRSVTDNPHTSVETLRRACEDSATPVRLHAISELRERGEDVAVSDDDDKILSGVGEEAYCRLERALGFFN